MHHYGVELFGLRFQHEALRDIRIAGKGKATAEVRFDPADMTRVFVSDPANRRFIAATCTDPSMHGLTLWQVKALSLAERQQRAATEDEAFFAREAEWLEVMGLTEALRPAARDKGKKALARSLTIPATPGEQLRHASLRLDDTSTFFGGARAFEPPPAMDPDYSNLPDLPDTERGDLDGDTPGDELPAASVASDLDDFAAAYGLNT